MSFFELIWLYGYIVPINRREEKVNEIKTNTILIFYDDIRSVILLFSLKIIFNFSNYKLTTTEEFVLKHGLNFCLSPGNVKSREVIVEFKVLFAKLLHHKAYSNKQFALRAKLNDVAHSHCDVSVVVGDYFDKGTMPTSTLVSSLKQ